MLKRACFEAARPMIRARWCLLCAAVAAPAIACGGELAPDIAASEASSAERPAQSVDLPGAAPEAPSLAACQTVPPRVWGNQAFAAQAGRFHVEIDATPSTAAMDAVIGLSSNAATSFAQLAAIARFNASGRIDVRAGSTYRADTTFLYQANTTYHLRFDVDLRGHRYSVFVRTGAGFYTALARDYAFRTEQAGATLLANVANEIDAAVGSFTTCDPVVVADGTTADGCVIADAGAGFVNLPHQDATVFETLDVAVTPSAAGLDAVVGVSAGPASSFSQLAAATRFSADNVLDVYDATGYRADVTRRYSPGTQYSVRMVLDLTTHTYSVFQGILFTFRDFVELGKQYRFRSAQSAVAHLDHLAVVVDGPAGSVRACPSESPANGVAYSREGTFNVLPLGGDEALISDATTTRRLDPGGRELAMFSTGGALAGTADHFATAAVTGTNLAITAYDRGRTAWSASAPVEAGTNVVAMAVAADSSLRVVRWRTFDKLVLDRFSSAGERVAQLDLAGDIAAFDGDDIVVGWNDTATTTIRVTRYGPDGTALAHREFAGSASITALAIDPAHGVVFGGELFTPVDFGGGPLPVPPPPENGPINAYVVRLAADGSHVFSRRTNFTTVPGIAVNATRIVASNTWRTQFNHPQLLLFDLAGNPVATKFNSGFGDDGIAGTVALSASGRVWWNEIMIWPLFPQWPYLLSFTP